VTQHHGDVTVSREQPPPHPYIVSVYIGEGETQRRRVVYGAATRAEAEQVAIAIRAGLDAMNESPTQPKERK